MIQTITILILLVTIFCFYWKISGKQMNIGSYLLLLYILSIGCTFVIKEDDKKYTFEASFYFIILLLFYLTPVLKFNSNKIQSIQPISLSLFNFISYVFIFFGFATYIYFLQIVLKLFLFGGSIMQMRTQMVGGLVYYDINIFYYFITFFCQFYPIVILFYFYSVTHTSNSIFFNRLLLFSSTGYIINVLASIGRDGFVLWTLSYVFTYILFRKFMTINQKAKMKQLGYYLIGIFSLIFIPITVSRFYTGGDYFSVINAIISYFGQEFGNFNNIYNTIPNTIDGFSRLFPIFDIGSNKKEALSLLEKNAYYISIYKIDINVFTTFIGDFYLYIEAKILFLLSAFYSIFLYFVFYRNKKVSFGKIILIVFFSQIPLHGLFYYKLAYVVCNLYMISIVILSLLFYKKIVIRKEILKD